MKSWVPALQWSCHLFGSGGYIRAEFRILYSLFTDRHCDQYEVRFNKGLIHTVRLFCDLLVPVHASLFNIWSRQGLVGLS